MTPEFFIGIAQWAIPLLVSVSAYLAAQNEKHKGRIALLESKVDDAMWKYNHLTDEGIKMKEKAELAMNESIKNFSKIYQKLENTDTSVNKIEHLIEKMDTKIEKYFKG